MLGTKKGTKSTKKGTHVNPFTDSNIFLKWGGCGAVIQ